MNSSKHNENDFLFNCLSLPVWGKCIKERSEEVWFLYIASLQQGDLRLSGLPSGQGTSGGARIHDRRVPADLRADSLTAVPPTPRMNKRIILKRSFEDKTPIATFFSEI
ncbi:hypothetical protein PoB_006895800 [Plakobranchus ocellatus]|uniref:Uncharacterized protein n=1 Tax=Plakobranchus ocellatus TaxID=259542 RepID=A0AAV4DDV1_9GAST|nr:hypothetical protein PoB_006895800 [Plakobranchus ocellatus]